MTLARRLTWRKHTFAEKKFRPYVVAIGQLALAWNDLHEKLGALFVTLNGGQNRRGLSVAIWNSSNFDRPKRQMLLGALQATPKDEQERFPKMMDDIKWMLDKANTLEDKRNDAIHSPLTLMSTAGIGLATFLGEGEDVVPDVALANTRGMKLLLPAMRKELLDDFRWCRTATLLLRTFSYEVDISLNGPISPWPDRPEWPTREQKKSRLDQRRPQKKE